MLSTGCGAELEITLIACAVAHGPRGQGAIRSHDGEPQSSDPRLPSPGLGHRDHCPFSAMKTCPSPTP